MKIKVLHIIKSLGRGGAEMLLPETLALHNQETFEFHYIYFLPWKDQMVDAINNAGGKVTCMPASNNIQLLAQINKVKNYINKYEIQLIHAHLPWAGFLSRFIHRSIKIPVIYTEHNKQERYHKITFLLNKLTFGFQNLVIAVSKDVESSIRRNISSKTNLTTVLNGVNTGKFKRDRNNGFGIRNQFRIPQEAVVVGTISVFRFQKRLKEWLNIFKEASERETNLYGIIVGDGPLKEELIEERKRLGLEQKVLMPGLQTDTIPWYSAMDIFMMSSIHEGLPIALLEAMSMECSIISTDAGGIKEVIENDKSGIIVPVNDWESLSKKLLMLDESTRRRLGFNARERVKTTFSLQSMVEQLEAIYKRMILS